MCLDRHNHFWVLLEHISYRNESVRSATILQCWWQWKGDMSSRNQSRGYSSISRRGIRYGSTKNCRDIGSYMACYKVFKIFTLFLNSLFSAWHSFISFSNVHRQQVSEVNLNCCGAILPWQLVHYLNDEGIWS